MKYDAKKEAQVLTGMYANGIEHVKDSPDLWAKMSRNRDSLAALVRLSDGGYYPAGWVIPFVERIGKPAEEISLDDIAVAIDPRAVEMFFPKGMAYGDLDQWRKREGQTYKVFTGTIDYMATGEGHTMIFAAARAYTIGDFLIWLAGEVTGYFAYAASVYDGLPSRDDYVIRSMLSEVTLNRIERQVSATDERAAHIEILYQEHVNYS